jgi:hypothetical protein
MLADNANLQADCDRRGRLCYWLKQKTKGIAIFQPYLLFQHLRLLKCKPDLQFLLCIILFDKLHSGLMCPGNRFKKEFNYASTKN